MRSAPDKIPGADAPAAACVVAASARVSHRGHTGSTRHSPLALSFSELAFARGLTLDSAFALALDDRIFKPYGVRTAGGASLSGVN
jgi:hypothetical protein